MLQLQLLIRRRSNVRHQKTRRKIRIANKSITESDRLTTPKQAKENVTPPNEHVHEHSVWEDVARESLEIALGRAKTYAEDMHKKDDSRSEEEYYSELLADAIKKGELKFDPKYLE